MKNNSLSTTKSALRYPGGKSRLYPIIREYFPETNSFNTYIEPFLGGGSVFLNFYQESLLNDYKIDFYISDKQTQLVSFWWVWLYRFDELKAQINILKSKSFEEVKTIFEKTKRRNTNTPKYFLFSEILAANNEDRFKAEEILIERAAKYYLLNRCSFSGLNRHFSFQAYESNFLKPEVAKPQGEFNARTGPILHQQDYLFYEENPRSSSSQKNDFWYLDPPYYGNRKHEIYGKGDLHKDFDYARFAKFCQNIKGKFLLTIDDHPHVRELFNWANIHEIAHTYSLNSNMKNNRVKELIIKNY